MDRRWAWVGAIGVALLAIWLLSGEPEPEAVPGANPAVQARRPAERRAGAGEEPRGSEPAGSEAAAAHQGPAVVPGPRATDGGEGLPPAPVARQAFARVAPGSSRADGEPARASPPPGASLDKEAIRGAIREIVPAVRDCYEQGRAQDPYLVGDATLSFTIEAVDREGRVKEAEFIDEKSSMADVLVQACMLEALSKARFPMPEGDGAVRVTYPFLFSQTDGGNP